MKKYYAGIGSRKLPEAAEKLCIEYAYKLGVLGYVLRSGGADGADDAFETTCIYNGSEADIFLPRAGFNGITDERVAAVNYILPDSDQMITSRQIMKETGIIPWWDRMDQSSKEFHSRNVNQVMGRYDSDEPVVDLVVYYAPHENGQPKGGTRTAVMLAKTLDKPVFNLMFEEDIKRLDTFIEEMSNDVSG